MEEERIFQENDDYEDCLDGLLAFLAALPEESIKLLNVPRYRQMLVAASRLKDLLCRSGEEGEIEIKLYHEFNLGSLTAEICSLTVQEPSLFTELVREADNFEVYPLTNGKLRIGIVFQSVLKTIG